MFSSQQSTALIGPVLETIHTHRSAIYPWCEIEDLKAAVQSYNLKLGDTCGLYWIYTKHSAEFLMEKCKDPRQASFSDIKGLISSYLGLNWVISPAKSNEAWWCVYSGIGGGKDDNLFKRISEHFSAPTSNTKSCLALGWQPEEVRDGSQWGVQVVLFTPVSMPYSVNLTYDRSRIYERGWRLQYGWPILSKA